MNMKYLKYFKESQSEITLKEKLESIVSMYQYLWSNNVDPDSLGNFTGQCSVLFIGCMSVNRGWSISKKEGRPYEFDVDCLLKKLETDYRKEEKLQNIEGLYKKSLSKRYNVTKEEIYKLLEPLINAELFNEKIITNCDIRTYYQASFKDGTSYPSFSIEFEIDRELITDTPDQSQKDKLREFYFIKTTLNRYLIKIKDKLAEIGLYPHWHDSTSFGNLFEIRLYLNQDSDTRFTFL
jgi:hypothetical protein